MAPVMTMAWALLANVFVMNLLISVFNALYTEMEETADSMWHWLHYQQLEGYMNKDDHEPGMQRSRGHGVTSLPAELVEQIQLWDVAAARKAVDLLRDEDGYGPDPMAMERDRYDRTGRKNGGSTQGEGKVMMGEQKGPSKTEESHTSPRTSRSMRRATVAQ